MFRSFERMQMQQNNSGIVIQKKESDIWRNVNEKKRKLLASMLASFSPIHDSALTISMKYEIYVVTM